METTLSANLTFHSPSEMAPTMGFSHVVEVTGGKLVFLSGQLGNDSSGRIVEGGFAAQAEQAFANADIALKAAGCSFKNAVKIVFYADASVPMSDLAALRAVRDRYINASAPPASDMIFVPRFVMPEPLFELSVIAAI